MSKFKMSKKDRKTLLKTILLLGRSFVQLGAQAGLSDEEGVAVCEIASKVASNSAALLGYSHKESMKITKEAYQMTDEQCKVVDEELAKEYIKDQTAKA